jgi:hypothetical protein
VPTRERNDMSLAVTPLLSLTDDELYERLSDAILGPGLAVGPSDQEQRRRFGRQWFSNRIHEIKQLVCEKELTREIRRAAHNDQLVAAATIADALIGYFGKPVSIVVAILIVRLGIDGFCQDYPRAR